MQAPGSSGWAGEDEAIKNEKRKKNLVSIKKGNSFSNMKEVEGP